MRFKIKGGLIIPLALSILLNISTITWIFLLDIDQPSIEDRLQIVLSKFTQDDSVPQDRALYNPLDILNLPQRVNSWNFDGEGWKVFFRDKKVIHSLVYNNHKVGFINLSPSHRKLGFYFYPENHSLGEIVLGVLDIDQRTVNEVYRGDNWTSNWEWKGDKAVVVKRSCGTGCMNADVIDIITGEKIESYRVY